MKASALWFLIFTSLCFCAGSVGVKRRLGIDIESKSSDFDATKNPFNVYNKIQWAKGKLTSVQLQRLAQTALEQGMPNAEPLARAGSHGKYKGNLHRDLVSLFGMPEEAAPIRWYEIPTKKGPKTPHPFLLPSEFLRNLYMHSRSNHWQTILGGADGAAERHWLSWAHTDFVRKHPRITESRFPFIIPIGMHGDGGAFSNQETINVFSWNSLLGCGDTSQTRFLFTLVKKSDIIDATMQAVLKIFADEMNALSAAHESQLFGSYSAVLAQVRGDWAFFCDTFHMPAWNSAVRMCWMCQASSTIDHLLWTNCCLDAGWRPTVFTNESFLEFATLHGILVPIFLLMVVGFRLECFMVDSLHAVDLGFWCHVVGNIFWHLAVRRRVFGGTTQSSAISNLWDDLTLWYKRTKCPYRLQSKLTENNLRSKSGFPKLKAKAAQARKLAPYLLLLAETYFSNDSEEEKLMFAIVRCMNRYYEIVQWGAYFLNSDEIAEMRKIGHTCFLCCFSLRKATFKSSKFVQTHITSANPPSPVCFLLLCSLVKKIVI